MAAPTHYIVDLLAPWGEIRLKRMFGGMGVYRDALFFAIIDEDVVYFKVDDTTRGDYESAQSEPFSYPHAEKDGTTSRVSMSGYWRVPDEILEDSDALALWAEKACAVARNKPAKGKTKTKGEMPGLGPKSLKWLKDIGVTSLKDLKNLGALETYSRCRARFPKDVTLNLLWGLYALVNDMDVKAVTPDIKEQLQAILRSHAG